jgi:hypothetical protein
MAHTIQMLTLGANDPPVNEALVLRSIVTSLEVGTQRVYSVNVLATEFHVKKRGLYDLITICSPFGICSRLTNATIEWFGLDRAQGTIDELRMTVQTAGRKTGLEAFFWDSPELSIPGIALAVVKLFFYLSVKSLDLRKVAKFFAQEPSKYKTMIRKMYTVAFGLELERIIRRTDVVSEIRFNWPIHAVPSSGLPGLSLMVNTANEVQDEQRYEQRRREFEELTVTPMEASQSRGLPPPDSMIPCHRLVFT